MEVQVPDPATALGKDLAGAALLDKWIDTFGIANMSDSTVKPNRLEPILSTKAA